MSNETQKVDANITVEIEEAELEAITDAIQVQTGIRAGRSIQPCL
jgi:hypothetical protein